MAGPRSSLHQELILDINTDVAEFCPVPGYFDYLAVGTYQLDEATRERHGRLHLYSLVLPSSSSSSSTTPTTQPTLLLAATLDLPGIFDLQWTQLPSLHDMPAIGLALADGTLQLLGVAPAPQAEPSAGPRGVLGGPGCSQGHLQGSPCTGSTDLQQQQQQQEEEEVQLHRISSCQAVSEGMALALDWDTHQQQQQQAAVRAAVSGSSGAVSVLQVSPTGVQQLLEWQGHELEAWMAAWDKHQANVLYSGADDCTFKGWDIRCPTAISTTTLTTNTNTNTTSTSTSSNGSLPGSPQQQQQQQQQPAEEGPPSGAAPLFVNRRAHAAGVCCISSHPRREHLLVTGSYDEALRLWDVRMSSRPLESCQVSTGGGVWRLKWHPHNDTLLLAACMYNGFALVEVEPSWSGLQVVEEYKGHDSIAYGADWYRGTWTGGQASSTQLPGPGSSSSSQQLPADAAGAAAEAVAGLQLGAQGQQPQDARGREQQPGQLRDIVATCSFYDRRLHLWTPGYTCRV